MAEWRYPENTVVTDVQTTVTTIDTKVNTINTNVANEVARQVAFLDFWSDLIEEVQLTAAAVDIGLAQMVVALPAGVTIERVVLMFMCRAIENTNVAANQIEATVQQIQVEKQVGGVWTAGIDILQGSIRVAASTREMGMVLIGDNDIKAEVSANGTYACQWDAAEATLANLNFNDVQVGMRVYFRA